MKRPDLKELLKKVGLTHEGAAEFLAVHRVTVTDKLGGRTAYQGDIEVLVAALLVMSPEQREEFRNNLREIRANRPQEDEKPPEGSI